MVLYRLIITDSELSYDGFSNDFDIGVFASEKEAEGVGEYYLTSVPGFKDYPCISQIEKKDVRDKNGSDPSVVWMAWGYNMNDKQDETDIVESPFYVTKEAAEDGLKMLQSQYVRDEWGIDRFKVGRQYWTEGFVRQ